MISKESSLSGNASYSQSPLKEPTSSQPVNKNYTKTLLLAKLFYIISCIIKSGPGESRKPEWELKKEADRQQKCSNLVYMH